MSPRETYAKYKIENGIIIEGPLTGQPDYLPHYARYAELREGDRAEGTKHWFRIRGDERERWPSLETVSELLVILDPIEGKHTCKVTIERTGHCNACGRERIHVHE